MEILDVDMQMVRDALANSPEYVKGHFENLLSEYQKAASRCEELTESEKALRTSHMNLEAELEEAQETLKAETEAHADDNDFHETALEAVKYWMHDVYVQKKPMSDPRKILRIVEDAL